MTYWNTADNFINTFIDKVLADWWTCTSLTMQIYIVLNSMSIAVDMTYNIRRTNRPTIGCLVSILKTLFWLIELHRSSDLNTKDVLFTMEFVVLAYSIVKLCQWMHAVRRNDFNEQPIEAYGISAENSSKKEIDVFSLAMVLMQKSWCLCEIHLKNNHLLDKDVFIRNLSYKINGLFPEILKIVITTINLDTK